MLYGKKEGNNIHVGYVFQEITGKHLPSEKADQGYFIPSGIWQ